MTFRAALLFIGGFLNRRDTANGLYESYLRTYHAHAHSDVLVQYLPWMADPKEVAASLRVLEYRNAPRRGESPRLAVCGYSFGGFTAVNICRALQSKPVDRLLLIDPVARWCGRFGWSRALFPGRVTIPPNVLRVDWYRQTHRRLRLAWPFLFPRSHRVVPEAPLKTPVFGPHDLPHEHTEIDHAALVQHAVDRIAKQVAGRPDPPIGFQTPSLSLFTGDDS